MAAIGRLTLAVVMLGWAQIGVAQTASSPLGINVIGSSAGSFVGPKNYNSNVGGLSNSLLGSAGALSLFAGGAQALVVNNTGITSNVGIGVGIAPSQQLQLQADDGFKPGGGTWGDTSDERLKTNFVTDFDALDKVRRLKPTLYDWKDPGTHSGIPQQKRVDLKAAGISGAPIEAGFIAQDLQKVFPDFVFQSDCRNSAECAEVEGGKIYTVTYSNKFSAYLVKSIQQLDERLKALEAK